MKKFLLALSVLSLVVFGCSKKDDTTTLADKTKAAAQDAADKTKEVATDTKNAISQKLTEWHLTAADIKADLQNGGRVVRSKTAAAGAKVGDMVDNARIVTVVKSKFVGDSDLSALKIEVDADQGTVTLKGTVASPDLIGRAVALALDTDGVNQVISLLTVETK